MVVVTLVAEMDLTHPDRIKDAIDFAISDRQDDPVKTPHSVYSQFAVLLPVLPLSLSKRMSEPSISTSSSISAAVLSAPSPPRPSLNKNAR